jgi:hypothetical protein
MDTALKELASSGALGAIVAALFGLLAIVIGVLVWALKRYVDTSMLERKDFAEFMKALTSSLNGLGLNFQATRADTLSVVRDLGTQIEHVTWAAHEKMVTVFRESLTGTANSIRESNRDLVRAVETQHLQDRVDELSHPHSVGDGTVRR